jgi:hypothetical protein
VIAATSGPRTCAGERSSIDMTTSTCWIDYKSDRRLARRVAEGWFTDGDKVNLPLTGFPARPRMNDYWTEIVSDWCEATGVAVKREGVARVRARVKKQHVEAFIRDVYLSEPSYTDPAQMLTWKGRAYLANALTDLRACVAQQLSPRLWYELCAEEID